MQKQLLLNHFDIVSRINIYIFLKYIFSIYTYQDTRELASFSKMPK